jgi:hypothetical protein
VRVRSRRKAYAQRDPHNNELQRTRDGNAAAWPLSVIRTLGSGKGRLVSDVVRITAELTRGGNAWSEYRTV